MATTFYPNDDKIGSGSTTYRFLDLARSNTVQTLTVTTVTSTTAWIPFGVWATRPLEPFTLSGLVSFNFWGLESNTTANAGLGLRLYKYSQTLGLGAQIIQIKSLVELGTSIGVQTASGTPPSTQFDSGDILVMEIAAVSAGSGGMNQGRTVDFTYGGSTVNSSGDSYVTITENVVLRNRVKIFG